MAEEKHCERKSPLETTFVSDTQAYGVMFTVAAKQDLLLIETLEISAVAPDRQKDVHVIVYTKEGDYHGFQNQPDQWVSIADTNVIPSLEGRGILIQPQEFHPVEVTPNSRRSFYVTLDTANLRYSNSPGRTAGAVYSEDDYLQIEVGAGLLEFPFSDRIFEPRVFCGILHYKRMISCDSVTMVQTKVVYHFIVQHDSTLPYNTIQSKVNVIVSGTIMALLQSDITLLSFQESSSLRLEDIQTEVPSTPFHSGALSECITNTDRVCTHISTRMTFGHTDRLKAGDVIYQVLQHRAKVSSNLDAGTSMDVVYAGWIPIQSQLILRVDGTPKDENMNAIQQAYMEDTLKRFLQDRMVRTPSAQVLEVHVNYQQSLGSRRNLQGTTSLDRPLASVDIFASIFGTLKPPNIIDFEYFTEHIVQDNAVDYMNDLKIRRDLTLDPRNSLYFADIQHISVGSERDAWKSGVDMPSKFTGWVIILVVTLVCLFAAMFLSLWRLRRRRQNSLDPEKKPFQDTTEVFTMDDIDEAYENAFRGIMDQKEADIMNQKAYSEELHPPDSPKTHSHPHRPMPLFNSSKRNQIQSKEHLVRIKSLDPATYMASQRDLHAQDSSRDIMSTDRSRRRFNETVDAKSSQSGLLPQNKQSSDPSLANAPSSRQVLSPQGFVDSMLRKVGEPTQINKEEWAQARNRQEVKSSSGTEDDTSKPYTQQGSVGNPSSDSAYHQREMLITSLRRSNPNYSAPGSVSESVLGKQGSRKELLTRNTSNRFSDRSLPSSRSSGSQLMTSNPRDQISDRSLQSTSLRHENLHQEATDARMMMKVSSDRSMGRNLMVEPQRGGAVGSRQQASTIARSIMSDKAKGQEIDVFEGEKSSSRRLVSERSQSQRDMSRERSLISQNIQQLTEARGTATLKNQDGRQAQALMKSEMENNLRLASSEQRSDSVRIRDPILKSSKYSKSSQRSLQSHGSMTTNLRVESNPDISATDQRNTFNLNEQSFDGETSNRMLQSTDRRLQIQRSIDNRNVYESNIRKIANPIPEKDSISKYNARLENKSNFQRENVQENVSKGLEQQGISETQEMHYEVSSEDLEDHESPIVIVDKKFLAVGKKTRLIDDVSSMGSHSGTSSVFASEHTVKRYNRGEYPNTNASASMDASETTKKRSNASNSFFQTMQE